MEMRKGLIVLGELSSAQWGLFTSAQAAERGVSRLDLSRQAEAGLLERVRHGVYRDAGAPADEYEALRAAWLALEPKLEAGARLRKSELDSVVSGTSAARLHGIGDLREDRLEFTTSKRRQTQRAGIHFTIRDLDREHVTIRHGLPTTTVERTLADLVAARTDLTHVAAALGDAMRQGSIDLGELSRQLAPLAARNSLPKNDGNAFVSRLLRLAGLDPDTTVKRIAGIETLAAPIAAEYLADISAAAQRLQDQLAQLQPSVPGIEEIREQAEALTRAVQPQLNALATFQRMHAAQAEQWQKAITRMAPSMEAIASGAKFAQTARPASLAAPAPTLTHSFKQVQANFRRNISIRVQEENDSYL